MFNFYHSLRASASSLAANGTQIPLNGGISSRNAQKMEIMEIGLHRSR